MKGAERSRQPSIAAGRVVANSGRFRLADFPVQIVILDRALSDTHSLPNNGQQCSRIFLKFL